MRFRTLLPLLCLAAAFVACSGGKNSKADAKPTPDNPATRAARAEEEFQRWGSYIDKEEGQFRTSARNAVAAFVTSSLPGWTVKGIASQLYEEQNMFLMDAELVRE